MFVSCSTVGTQRLSPRVDEKNAVGILQGAISVPLVCCGQREKLARVGETRLLQSVTVSLLQLRLFVGTNYSAYVLEFWSENIAFCRTYRFLKVNGLLECRKLCERSKPKQVPRVTKGYIRHYVFTASLFRRSLSESEST